jgi:hypothetical protein
MFFLQLRVFPQGTVSTPQGARMPLSFFHLLSLIPFTSVGATATYMAGVFILLLGWRVKTLKVTPTGVTVTFK